MSKRQKKVADALATPPSGEEVKEENKLARFSRGVRAVMPACIQQLFQAVGDELRSVYRRPREALLSVVNLLCVLFTALMLWRVLVVYSNSPSPVVVVLSGSMEPALQRGDILFLVDRGPDLKAGDIIVFK
ncbi:signal peptidase, partial [Toxoplasma gondii TgCatPRC2]